MEYLWPGLGGPNIDYITGPPSGEYRRERIRKLAVLGSTGSVGRATLEAVDRYPENLRVEALACGTNWKALAAQAARYKPSTLVVRDESSAEKLRAALADDYRPLILTGPEGYARAASLDEVDCVAAAQVGAAGLDGALAAARAGKVIALANKESLVICGDLLRKICAKSGAAILPVDSEHYALFQCAAGRGQTPVKLILTGSGGPFRGLKKKETDGKTAAEAGRHPNWRMGPKITIDSATLMNKGLEFIEAARLFGVSIDQVEIVIHPQSVVHSLVRFEDNSLLAQLAVPDMRLPIAGCLLWPRDPRDVCPPLDLTERGSLTFEKPDIESFPCLRLALEAAAYEPGSSWRETGLNPATLVLNAANEAIVELFLAGEVEFGAIPAFVELALNTLAPRLEGDLKLAETALADPARVVGFLGEETRRVARSWLENPRSR